MVKINLICREEFLIVGTKNILEVCKGDKITLAVEKNHVVKVWINGEEYKLGRVYSMLEIIMLYCEQVD